MKFDDINLNDDKGVPKLDLDLGFDKKTESPAENKGFSFGWGGGWGGGSSSWGFAGKEETPADTKQDDSSWGFSKKDGKDDKKKKSTGTDWGFDALGGDSKTDDLDLGLPAAKEEPKVESDPWASFSTAKDKKKKKKGGIEPVRTVASSKLHLRRNCSGVDSLRPRSPR